MKQTKCKICRTLYTKRSISHKVCSVECAVELQSIERKKKSHREHCAAKVKARSRGEWTKLAQAAFNKFIRLRDDHLPCISCGRHHNGRWNAGHYLSVGARPDLRFNENNVSKQCMPCNDHLSGNVVLYRIALIKKIGLEEVEKLEGPHPPQKWSIVELQEILKCYLAKAKELTKERINE